MTSPKFQIEPLPRIENFDPLTAADMKRAATALWGPESLSLREQGKRLP